MAHMHITSWAVAIILLFVVAALYKQGKAKPAKITHMILRVFYILIIVTGFGLIGSSFDYYPYIIKMIVGLIVISAVEMILVRGSKGKSTGTFWILFAVSFAAVLYLGLSLPINFQPFANPFE